MQLYVVLYIKKTFIDEELKKNKWKLYKNQEKQKKKIFLTYWIIALKNWIN